MKKSIFIVLFFTSIFLTVSINISHAFWVWSPKTKKMVNPKFAAKDTPREQYDWAMQFYKAGDFKRSAEEFIRLTESYRDSDLSPEAQYYAGRSYEELGKYYFAYQQYQKTLDNYPYTKRQEEIIEREYNIANLFQKKESPKLMDMELNLSLDRAIIVYKKIIDNSPFGIYADKSLFKMAECYRRLKQYDGAIEAYEKLVTDYPESRLFTEAKYQLAYTRYEASLDPEYDQEVTEDALREFKQISRSTPDPTIAAEAEKMLGELKNRKADSMVKTAEFYEKRGKPRSAVIYYQDVVNKYSGTTAAKYAKERIDVLKKRIKN